MGGSLFMGGDHMVQPVAGLVNGIVNIQDLSAGIAEYIGDTLLDQRFNDDLRSGEFLFHRLPPNSGINKKASASSGYPMITKETKA